MGALSADRPTTLNKEAWKQALRFWSLRVWALIETPLFTVVLASQHLLQQFPVVRGLAGGLGLAAPLIAHGVLDALRLSE